MGLSSGEKVVGMKSSSNISISNPHYLVQILNFDVLACNL